MGYYIFDHLNPSHLKCVTCSKQIADITKSRAVPEPSVIWEFLSQNNDSSENISTDGRVCFTCYKSHLLLVKHLKGSVISTDADLKTLIHKIEASLPALSTVTTYADALSYVSSLLATYVGKALLNQTALLLPKCENFQVKPSEVTTKMNISMRETPTSIWLRSELSTKLEHHLAYKCSVMRLGTVLYRYDGDIFHAFSVALGQARNRDTSDQLSQICLSLNAKCHTTIKDLIQQDSLAPHNIESTDINKFISDLDPDISLLTKPLSKKANRPERLTSTYHTKILLCVFTTFQHQQPVLIPHAHTLSRSD